MSLNFSIIAAVRMIRSIAMFDSQAAARVSKRIGAVAVQDLLKSLNPAAAAVRQSPAFLY